ncbi:hypothetical protein BDE36_2012 [Arcticibacter tournemirensis]|nr:hypothetical protein BDE36_2012 [Arcticibacter tournemirensis]
MVDGSLVAPVSGNRYKTTEPALGTALSGCHQSNSVGVTV